jgi:hypothetical protein
MFFVFHSKLYILILRELFYSQRKNLSENLECTMQNVKLTAAKNIYHFIYLSVYLFMRAVNFSGWNG